MAMRFRKHRTIRLADYYSHHVSRVYAALIGLLVLTGATITAVIIAGDFVIDEAFVMIGLPLVLMMILTIIITLRIALEPLEVLTRVITRLSDQSNDITAPAINNERYVQSGLKDMVQTIYDRLNSPAGNDDTVDQKSIQHLLQLLPCGLIGIDQDQEIAFANNSAPVATDINEKRVLQLAFPINDTLNSWLTEVRGRTITETRSWLAVPTSQGSDAEKRIYDVIAKFQRATDGSIDTILLLIDKTNVYQDGQETVDFISIAAHELRGPITVIRGYLDVLTDELSDTLDDDHRDLLNRLDTSASRLNGYVSNILNVAKYDQKHLKLHLEKDTFENLYGIVANDLALRASTQNRRLTVTIPPDLPAIAVDQNSISEVLLNLVDNAIKYSRDNGEVQLSVSLEADFVKCSIKDNGIGVPSGVAQNLFQKFYRSHRSRSSVTGTGLGLYISRAIVESHGGQIGFTSTEGQGSTFYFTIPTYSSVAQKLSRNDGTNSNIIKTSSGWIRNHSRIGG